MKYRLAALLLLSLLFLPASADELHDRFDRVVKQLRSDDAAERDKGSAELEAIAKEAPELVRALAEDKDPEVRGRALAALKRLEDAAAETLFMKVEKKYAESKTVQYKVTIVSKDTDIKESLVVYAKVGNMFRFEGTLSLASGAFKVMDVCDGTFRVEQREGEPGTGPERTSVFVSDLMRGGMIRYGILNTMECVRDGAIVTMSKEYVTEGFRAEADECVEGRIVKVMTYSVRLGRFENSTTQQKVWIDAERLTVLKRELTVDQGVRVTETYSDTKFDEEIPDERFALPKETKEK